MTSPSPALPPTPPPPNPLTLGYVRIAAYAVVTAVALGTPFALQAGAEFFLPITAAIVVAIALVPALEWLERRGVPSGLAALACVLSFLLLINGGLALIVVPASGWFVRLPESLPRIQANLAPLIDFYASLQRYVDEALTAFADNTAAQMQQVAVQTPTSLLDYLTGSAPAAAIQTLFSILLIYFFLAGWTRLRGRTIRSRGSFDDAMNTARVIQNVVDATSAYLSTIVFINAMLGLSVALLLWALGMPSPFMWGGIVTLCNFIPYVGPIVAAGLLGIGGLMTFDSMGLALLPAMIQIGLHTIEANIITPLVLGRRLTINPMLILISLSFWGWVWGTPGALLAVPILIIAQTLFLSFRGERPEWAPPVSRVEPGEEENVANAGAGG